MEYRGTRLAGRILVAAIALALAVSGIAACIVDSRYSFWALNDSDNPVVIVIRENGQETYTLPPHAYGGLLSGMGDPKEGWVFRLVDDQCRPLQEWPVDARQDLLYFDEAGHGELLSDHVWSHNLRTAKSTGLTHRDPPCP